LFDSGIKHDDEREVAALIARWAPVLLRRTMVLGELMALHMDAVARGVLIPDTIVDICLWIDQLAGMSADSRHLVCVNLLRFLLLLLFIISLFIL
jgi:hypothetical protein